MVSDVSADGVNQLAGGCNSKGTLERHQANPSGEPVDLLLALVGAEETAVQQGHGDDAVHLQSLELARTGHRGGYHAHGDGSNQVEEYR